MVKQTTQEIYKNIKENFKFVFILIITLFFLFIFVLFYLEHLNIQISSLPHKVCENVTEIKSINTQDSFYITGLNCSKGSCHYDNAIWIEGVGLCYKQNSGDYHCPV